MAEAGSGDVASGVEPAAAAGVEESGASHEDQGACIEASEELEGVPSGGAEGGSARGQEVGKSDRLRMEDEESTTRTKGEETEKETSCEKRGQNGGNREHPALESTKNDMNRDNSDDDSKPSDGVGTERTALPPKGFKAVVGVLAAVVYYAVWAAVTIVLG